MEKANNKEALNLNNNYKYITPYTLGLVMSSPTNCPIRIGDILISTISRNPSEDYVGTEWVSFGTGRCLVGVDTSQTEFNTVEKTGGSKYLQKHTHNFKSSDYGWEGNYIPGIGYNMNGSNNIALSPYNAYPGSGNRLILQETGTGDSENLQPYITVYFYKRIK